MRSKITVVGAGNVGASCAQRLGEKGYADVVLVDIIEGMPQGKALDMMEANPVVGSNGHLIGTNGYAETANSDIVIITSGVARRPGMSRDDLLFTNMEIIKGVTEQVVKYSPNCVIIMVANPLDAMAQLAFHVSKFPRNRVVGMAGVLDTARFRTFLAMELKASVEDINTVVLGGHGDDMVPLTRLTTVGGIPVTELLDSDTLARIVDRTRKGGGEIVSLLKTGSAYYAPSAAAVEMAEAILFDKNRILPCAAYLDGEYDIKGLFVGVPVKLGAGGIKEIIQLKLGAEEKAALQKSSASVKELVDTMMTKLS